MSATSMRAERGSADWSWLIAPAILGAGAGALGLPITAAQQLDRQPALFVVGTVLAVAFVIVARRYRAPGVVAALAALTWLLIASALILVFVRTDHGLTDTFAAVVSFAAPDRARLESAAWLGLGSGLVAVISMAAAHLTTSGRLDNGLEAGGRR